MRSSRALRKRSVPWHQQEESQAIRSASVAYIDRRGLWLAARKNLAAVLHSVEPAALVTGGMLLDLFRVAGNPRKQLGKRFQHIQPAPLADSQAIQNRRQFRRDLAGFVFVDLPARPIDQRQILLDRQRQGRIIAGAPLLVGKALMLR